MLCLPHAYKNIIVGLKWKGKFTWYVSIKEMWFLNETELNKSYENWCKDKGLPLDFADSKDDERYGIPILNEDTIETFLPKISKFIASVDELREYLKLAMEIETQDDIFIEYKPSLYIDFDQKNLFSMYSEPSSYEDYMPANWKGYFQSFLDMIEPIDQFWRENGKTIIDFKKG